MKCDTNTPCENCVKVGGLCRRPEAPKKPIDKKPINKKSIDIMKTRLTAIEEYENSLSEVALGHDERITSVEHGLEDIINVIQSKDQEIEWWKSDNQRLQTKLNSVAEWMQRAQESFPG